MLNARPDLLSMVFGLGIGLLWLIWTGRLLWVATSSLRQRTRACEPPHQLSASDLRFLRSLHIRP